MSNDYRLLPDGRILTGGRPYATPNAADEFQLLLNGFVAIGGRLYSADASDEYGLLLQGLLSIGKRLYSAGPGGLSDEDIRGKYIEPANRYAGGPAAIADAERHVWATQFLPVWEGLDAESLDYFREQVRSQGWSAVFDRALADAEARRDARIGEAELIE